MRRRWRKAPSADWYVDTWHIYPPVSALELHGLWGAQFGWATQKMVTAYARKRGLRYHPWKIAR